MNTFNFRKLVRQNRNQLDKFCPLGAACRSVDGYDGPRSPTAGHAVDVLKGLDRSYAKGVANGWDYDHTELCYRTEDNSAFQKGFAFGRRMRKVKSCVTQTASQ